MSEYLVVFNPYSSNGNGEEKAKMLSVFHPGHKFSYKNITEIENYADFFSGEGKNADIILAGGDGTLNRFINDTEGIKYENRIYYYAVGSGNDFARDIGMKDGDIKEISKYLRSLPKVTVNGKTSRFLDNVGFGIDGYCSEEGDKLRAKSKKNINYAAIAIKGLLFYFKPRDAKITVDGTEYEFKKCWLAPAMHGRYYGGGMMPTPDQDRLSKEKELSVLVWHGSGKLSTLMAFPSIFKGEHIKHENMCKVLKGKNIKVEFSSPCPLQIDGETVTDVTSYEANAAASAQEGTTVA